MSRLSEIKKQYPELNITFIDILSKLDTSKTYKYLPLLCKIFGKRFSVKDVWSKNEIPMGILETEKTLESRGISIEGLTDNEKYSISTLCDFFQKSTFVDFKDFIHYMDADLIDNKDVTSFKDINEIRNSITLATLKENLKYLESQIIREYEDSTWLILRPLTFDASSKYGANTKWCTTYSSEKSYFQKYWNRGILLYFINKVTGYKLAGFKSLDDYEKELSFWNQEDIRIDYLDADIDVSLFPIVKKLLDSNKTNRNFCSDELANQVIKECQYYELKSSDSSISLTIISEGIPQQPTDPMAEEITESVEYEDRSGMLMRNDLTSLIQEMYSEDVPVRA